MAQRTTSLEVKDYFLKCWSCQFYLLEYLPWNQCQCHKLKNYEKEYIYFGMSTQITLVIVTRDIKIQSIIPASRALSVHLTKKRSIMLIFDFSLHFEVIFLAFIHRFFYRKNNIFSMQNVSIFPILRNILQFVTKTLI